MNLEHYKNFRVMVESGSLAAAAKKLHIAQSALSSQLKMFEKKFGAELLVTKRGVRKLKLTEAGKILYEKSSYICQLDDMVLREIDSLRCGTEGTLRISLSPSMSLEFIEDWLSGFSKRYPGVQYELHEVSVTEMEKQLLNGLTEIGIARAPWVNGDVFDNVYEACDSLMVVYPSDNPWIVDNGSNTLLVSELCNVPLNLTRGFLTKFKSVCADIGFEPYIQSVNTTKTSTIIWAKKGLGVAIVPMSKEEIFGEGLCSKFIDSNQLRIKKTIVTVKNRELSSVAKLFLEYCGELRLGWKKIL